MPFKFNFKFKDAKAGAAITVQITPQAESNAVTEVLEDGTVCVRLTAPPLESALQEALAAFLCQILNLKSNQVEIVAGTPLNKLVSLIGVTPSQVDEVMRRLAAETANSERATSRTKGRKGRG